MTVQTNTNVASFNGNGVTQIFPIAFKFNNDTDLVVLRVDDTTGVASRLTLNSDYTVSGEGDESGGLINVVTAPLAGQRLIVSRIVDILQLVDLRNQGKFFAEVHEDAFDLLTMIAQQHETSLSSSIRVAEEDRAPKRLPSAKSRADRLMGFDSNGDPVAVVATSGTAAELAVDLLNSADPAKGSAMVGHNGATVREALLSAERSISALSAYAEVSSLAGVVTIDVSKVGAVGVELYENVTELSLVGAVPGGRASIDIYFKQPDGEDGKSVSLPSSIKAPSGVLAEVDPSRAATTMLRLVSVDGGVEWRLDARLVYFGVAMYQLPQLATEHATFNDEGDSASGWTSSNATITSSGSYLRQTKQAAGSNSSMTKPISFTPASSDFILYGKVRAKHDASTTAVIWLLNGSKEISIWLGSAAATVVAVQGAISICGTTGASTRNVVQVASGYNYESTPIEFALQFDQKFRTLTCWFREADGRWKFRGRVACDWFSSAEIQALTTTPSAAGAWVEFDYLMLARPNLAVLSDSIGEGKTLFSPNPSLGLTNDESTWMRHAPIYPNLRNNLIVNKGVGGQSSAQILARVTDVTSTGARVVFLHASSNDEALSVTQAARTENIQSTVSAITATGGQVVLLNAMYGTSAGGDNTPTPDLRDYMRTWWNGGRLSVSGAAAVFDIMEPLRVSGDYLNATLTQSDGIHPNVDGHSAIGAYIASFQ